MKNRLQISLFISLLIFLPIVEGHQHNQKKNKSFSSKVECENADIRCAKTVTSAFAPNGDLWRLWSHQEQMYFQISTDKGEHFSIAQQVSIPKEKISARNENRPKIAFDEQKGVYLSWATPRAKKYTADIRFSYSADYGKTFSQPITVNNDNLLTGHSFNEMTVSADGHISIVWLDSRLKYRLQQQGKKTNGSALYLAKARIAQSQKDSSLRTFKFTNQQLANNTCVCCRIAMDADQDNNLAIFWRHIYGDNIREFALLTLNDKLAPPIPKQISNDHWQINGCPHQGGGISIDENNRYHLTWFNQGSKGKGIFYAFSDDKGDSTSYPISIGNLSQQAAHPHLLSNKNIVDIVWLEFNGEIHQLWHQQSVDFGQSFSPAKQIAQANHGADRPFIIKQDDQNFISWQRPKQGHWIKAL